MQMRCGRFGGVPFDNRGFVADVIANPIIKTEKVCQVSFMKRLCCLLAFAGMLPLSAVVANAQILIGGSLNNGNLDRSYAQEIVPGFFLPKPAVWINVGTRAITGPYEDEMSSEPWAGPAPTPVTTDGLLDPPFPAGVNGPDGAVFFKPFSGNLANGAATGHLFQDHPGLPGLTYSLSGWAGAEANYLAGMSVFAIDFFGAGGVLLGGSELDLVAAGLFTPNGEAFNYRQYTVTATAPAGTSTVRARVSMIDGMSNPAGGGQAFVVDDFQLAIIPEPSVFSLAMLGILGLLASRRRN
jgi:hypothetical protein